MEMCQLFVFFLISCFYCFIAYKTSDFLKIFIQEPFETVPKRLAFWQNIYQILGHSIYLNLGLVSCLR